MIKLTSPNLLQTSKSGMSCKPSMLANPEQSISSRLEQSLLMLILRQHNHPGRFHEIR